MNILLIGNGFDLAHGLPTKYTDFLNFCLTIRAVFTDAKTMDEKTFESNYLRNWKCNKELIEKLKYIHYCICIKNNEINYLKEHPYLREMYEVITKNTWIDYFLRCNMYRKENWIDFEKEISKIIQSIDNDMKSGGFDKNEIISEPFLSKYLFESLNCVKNYDTLIEILERDLDRLIRALEIYLAGYVEKLDYNIVSPDIELIINNNRIEKQVPISKFCRTIHFEDGTEAPPVEMKLQIDYIPYKIISFNYTNTYMNIYNQEKLLEEDIDYIHGKSDINNNIELNNMVLGIDEYLHKKRKNKDVDFIAFKKFYQRIYKETGCKYKEWVEEIRKSKTEQHNLYIFGHSLDVTDKDVLRDLILNDNVYTTIYYLNKTVMGKQIANLVKVIGQDELIRRTGGSTKTIKFKLQQDMVEKGVK